MLNAYLTETTRLLQNPSTGGLTLTLYSTADLTAYINTARSQLAGEAKCIRVYGFLATTAFTRVYPFSVINTTATPGISGVFNVQGATVSLGAGQVWLRPRPFPYFQLYFLNNPVPVPATPVDYSQYGQGVNGTLYFDPIPDGVYTINVDAVCNPVALIDDTTPEAIPYPWTDCVPYFAAYYAYLSAQRTQDADHMFQLYQQFMARARLISNGEVNPEQYPQNGNPTRANQLGISSGGGG